MIRQGDWIRHRKCKHVSQVVKVRRDGLLVVEWQGYRGKVKRRTITRPEEYVIERKREAT